MERPALTVQDLEAAGFRHSGDWVLEGNRIRRQGILPTSGGVYAFSQSSRVMYVGLASTNLTKRLYFYQNPGATQRTNIRLNAIIAEALREDDVAVYFACPPDFEWNGLVVRGAEGLEAGLIAGFQIPWNMRGMPKPSQTLPIPPLASGMDAQEPGSLRSPASATDRVLQYIRDCPRRTEAEIARGVFGRTAPQQRANTICRALSQSGQVRRLGSGGPADPFVYVASST